jgi:alanyl-tRNA synthetase
MPLRKEPARGGMLRLIDVEEFDLSACGGTHVARTGGIGMIAVAGWERFKGGQRIEFVCGGRALGAFRSLRDTVTAGVRLLSVLPGELPSAIERLQADAKDHKRAMSALQGDLARYHAEELAASAETVRLSALPDGHDARLVARAVDADANGLKTLATAIVARPGYLVVLVSARRRRWWLSPVRRMWGPHSSSSHRSSPFGGRGGAGRSWRRAAARGVIGGDSSKPLELLFRST